VLKSLRAAGSVIQVASGALVHTETVRHSADRLLSGLRAFHAANPQRAGAPREELLAQTGLSAAWMEVAFDWLLARKEVTQQGTVIAQAGWTPRLLDAEEQFAATVEAAFRKAAWATPSVSELPGLVRAPSDRIEPTVRLLVERGVLVRLDAGIFMHQAAIAAAQEVALRLFRARPAFSTMQFRDALGVSRKFAVPLLDHLDRLRFTVRNGHDRTPGSEAKKLLQ
jgi:selenocysteine-specific elongation factor